MADNVVLDPGAGGDTVAADDDGTAKHQYVKLEFGADNTQTKVQASAPLPVQIGDGTDAALVSAGGALLVDASATTQPVSNAGLTELAAAINGSSQMDVNLAANGIGIATSAKQDTIITSVQLADDVVYVDDADWTDDTSKHTLVGGVYQSAPHTVTDGDVTPFLTDVNGRVATVVSGNVAVTNAGLTELAAAINASSQMDVNIAASNATVTVSNAGLTELAGAINASAQMDVNLAANGIGIATSAKQDTEITALQLIDDPVVVLGTATYTEAASKGNTIAVVRRDADTTLVDTTNEFTALQVDANGALKVEIFDGGASHTVDNNGTFVTQVDGAALTALQLIDDVVYTDDTSTHATGTSKGALIMAAAAPTDSAVNANDIGAVGMTVNREMYVSLTTAIPAGNNNIGDVDVASVTGNVTVIQGTAASLNMTEASAAAIKTSVELIDDAIFVDDTATHSTGVTKVMGIGAAAVPTDTSISANDIGMVGMTTDRRLYTEATIAAAQTLSTVTTVTTLTGTTSLTPGTAAANLGKAEDAGHTTADVGVMALGVRVDTPNAAAVNTDADYTYLATDRVGGIHTALYETDFAVLGTNHVKKYYTNAGAVTDGIVWSPAAGKRFYITDIFINTSAAATITLEDDVVAGDVVLWKAELAANSGWSHHYGTPLFSGEDAADLLVTTSAGNVYISITGYEI